MLVRIDGQAAEFPWYLGHICSPWRAVFLSMRQEFWGKFMLYPPTSRSLKFKARRCAALVKLFIECARGQPFSFDIHQDTQSRIILKKFMKESSCWLDASFSIAKSEISSLLKIKNRLPHLRSPHLTHPKRAIPKSCRDIFLAWLTSS